MGRGFKQVFEFKTIASGSSGNCHYLRTDDAFGLIDIGIQWKRIQKAIDFKASSLDFALATHRHLDHAGHIKDAIKAGVDVYAIQDVWDSNGINSHRAHTIVPKQQFRIKSLTILPFPVPHDVENVGFLIADQRGNKLLYLTDCYYSPFKFKDVTILAIECNYTADILADNIKSGIVSREQKRRILQSHFSLENVKEFFRANDLRQVQEIHLIHISKDSGHPEMFIEEIQKLTGKPTFAH